MTFLRRARRLFSSDIQPSQRGALGRQTEAFHTARIVVRCYYAVVLFFAVATLHDWPAYLDRQETLRLWPVGWLNVVPLRTGILGILVGYLVTALLGAIFPERRWTRALVFAGLIEFAALENSFGKISHNYHLWVLTAFWLVFLPQAPARTADRATRQRFLLTFWGCQAIVLLTYTMSGVGKIGGAIYQLCAGQNNLFAPTGLASIVADRLLQTNSSSWLGPWLLAHPWLGWPLGLAAIYLELFAFWAAFRPALQRWWAAGLIVFHIGVYLLMGITFAQTVLLLGLLLLAAPLSDDEQYRGAIVKQLPLLSWVLRKVFRSL
jgi:hypothetical protein